MTSDAAFDWFWQPPLSGDPGIIMIVEKHPGPHQPEIPFIHEDTVNVLSTIEGRIPEDVHLFQLRIYYRDVFHLWTQVTMTGQSRAFRKGKPDFAQGDLEQLWKNHETAGAS